MSKKNYSSKEDKLFIGFFPPPVFENMDIEERKFYKQYRDNHRWIHGGNQRIEKCKKEIEKLKTIIQNTRLQINGDSENSGWKQKMLEGYSHVSHLSKDFEFWCSVNIRNRKSKTLINKERKEQGRSLKLIRSEKGDFKVHPKYYIRVESKLKGEWLKNIYVGSKEDVQSLLNQVFINTKDWTKVTDEVLKTNLKDIYTGYTRYHIYQTNPQKFCSETHSLSKVKDWGKTVEDIFDWMDK
ncbi:hypothetical protein [uncultured Zobellia sp.]|uniref:hypothetical protein n=1 Tax=uncultured Zobellia sp. TaxID=255433 RepID=UPI00259A78A7|nr:hypothetical protein [uncultured Zobellia sp.]